MITMPLVIQLIENNDDREYMQWLYEEHHRLMLSTAWKYSSEQFEVEDIVSDSIVALIRRIDQLRNMERNALRLYIVSTVRNTAINHFRKDKAINMHVLRVENEIIDQIVTQEEIERKIVLHDELLTTIKVIHTLPHNEQIVLRMKCLDGLSNADIAKATGLAQESIRKYLSRARQKVRDALYEMEVSTQ